METNKTELINGGLLVRAPKTCECKLPDINENSIQEDDEWACSCGQGWRARVRTGSDQDPLPYWKRISTAKRAKRSGPSRREPGRWDPQVPDAPLAPGERHNGPASPPIAEQALSAPPPQTK